MGSNSRSVNSRMSCYCGEPALLRVFSTSKNPVRKFFGCKNYKEQSCRFFRWYDEDEANESRYCEIQCRFRELEGRNQELKRECEELKKQMEEERECKMVYKKKYESLVLKKKLSLYLICILCLWKWFT